MPKVKVYMIVTNDEYETPVKFDLIGAKATAEYLGISLQVFRKCLRLDKWSHLRKYKACVDEYATERMSEEMRKKWTIGTFEYNIRHSKYQREKYKRMKERKKCESV